MKYDFLGIFVARKTKCGLWLKMWGLQLKRQGRWQIGWQRVIFYNEDAVKHELGRKHTLEFVVT